MTSNSFDKDVLRHQVGRPKGTDVKLNGTINNGGLLCSNGTTSRFHLFLFHILNKINIKCNRINWMTLTEE